jgi:hypothetical protein
VQFTGWIAGLGTDSGHRVVIGHWHSSPYGVVTDVMVEDPAGHRTLYAPTPQLAEFLADVQPGAAFVDHLHPGHLLVVLVRRPAGPTEETTLKGVLAATVRGAGKAPASVLSTGSLAPRRAELGRATRFSSLVAAPGHGGLITAAGKWCDS